MSESKDTNLVFEYSYIFHNHLSKRNTAVVLFGFALECDIGVSQKSRRDLNIKLSWPLAGTCYHLVNFQPALVDTRATE